MCLLDSRLGNRPAGSSVFSSLPAVSFHQIPPDLTNTVSLDFAPHRPGKHDPEGCILAPAGRPQGKEWELGSVVELGDLTDLKTNDMSHVHVEDFWVFL